MLVVLTDDVPDACCNQGPIDVFSNGRARTKHHAPEKKKSATLLEKKMSCPHWNREHIGNYVFILYDHKDRQREVDPHDLADDIRGLGGNEYGQTNLKSPKSRISD
jgi:hypothetical protein